MQKMIDIRHLTIAFDLDEGRFQAVNDLSLQINRGEIVGLVGESGCGKSVTALSILNLLPSPPASIEEGTILFDDKDLLQLPVKKMRKIRGRRISMIFQEPLSSLSPLKRIGHQMVETLQLHSSLSKDKAWEMAVAWLERVQLPKAARQMEAYPFHLSGGMQQRVMIAMAMMLEPDLIIADEPTTALDVTIQAQIFRLLGEMRKEKSSILLITHDMGAVWEMCDRVYVMYASKIVEAGRLDDIFFKPAHPYTLGLLAAIPRLSDFAKQLKTIKGQVPSPFHYPTGCCFNDRCPYALNRCGLETPVMIDLKEGHRAACFRAAELMEKRVAP